jgi:LCP family protein required for cell wall assembly
MSPVRAFLDYMLYFCAFAVIGIGCLGAYDAISYPVTAAPGLEEGGAEAPGPLQMLPRPFPDKQYVSVLIVGADERKRDVGRSDTMMVLFLNPRRAQAALLSIPRDLKVRIPGHRGTDRINASYPAGGVELVQRTVEELLDIEIDYHAKANFQGFVEVVDTLGGVDIEVPDVEGRGRGMNYDDRADGLHIHLKPGFQHLDGEQAIGFVRYRKGDSDFKRMERQQQFLTAMAEQKLKLRNIRTLVGAARRALDCIDTDMDLREAMDLARAIKQLDSANLMSVQVPAAGRMENGKWYAIYRESDIRQVLREIYAHLDSEPAKPCTIEVLNGSGQTGAAAAAGSLLSAKGFELTDTGNADRYDYEHTLIQYPRDRENTARMVRRVLGCGELERSAADLTEADAPRIRVIIGGDFEQEHE